MSGRSYREFDLLAEGADRDQDGLRRLTVRLLESPAGDHVPIAIELDSALAIDLAERLGRLATRDLDQSGVIALGAALADLLLPGGIRHKLASSIGELRATEGLRIRLRLDPGLADFPWEYAWVARQNGQLDSSGFLALDPRISIVRHETVEGRAAAADTPRDRRVLAALADPTVPGSPPLNLDAERLNLQKALAEVPGIAVDFVDNPTMANLEEALLDGADVFHFAGHGEQDVLVLVDEDDRPSRLPAEQLAINLRARGVQLVVLGACESAARAQRDPWSGVATRLVAANIPAVVAMQYRINDRAAIDFGHRLYRSLAAGLPLDEAVAAGRLAIYNLTTGGKKDPRKERIWRDWGVPVVYMRKDASVSLVSVPDETERERLADEIEATIRVRVDDVSAGGEVIGLEAGVISAGRIDVEVIAGNVRDGTVTGVVGDHVEGGTIDARVTADGVGGKVVGASFSSVGGGRRRRRRTR